MEDFKVTIDKLVSIFIGCDALVLAGLFGYTIYKSYLKNNDLDRYLIIAIVVCVLFVCYGIYLFATLNKFVVNVEGQTIHVKDGKKLYDIKVNEIDKIVFSQSTSTKGMVTLICEIKSGDNKLRINSQHKGFLNMLDYLKYHYDCGSMDAKAFSEGGYKRLLNYAERCPEGRKRKKLKEKENS